MPRLHRTHRNRINLSNLINRARAIGSQRQRRVFQSTTMGPDSLAMVAARSMRQQGLIPRMRMPAFMDVVSSDALTLDEIPEQRNYRKRSATSSYANSTIVLHQNPDFNAIGAPRSGLMRLDAESNAGTIDSQSDHRGSKDDDIDIIPAKRICLISSEVETIPSPMEVKPKVHREAKSKKRRHASDVSENSSTSSTVPPVVSVPCMCKQCKSFVDKNSYDEAKDDIVKVEESTPESAAIPDSTEPKGQRPLNNVENVPEPLPTPAAPLGMGTWSTFATMGTASSLEPLPHTSALGCPTLSAILLSVDNFLKRREFSNSR